MRRALIIGSAGIALVLCAAQAAVSATTATTPVAVKFVESAGINIGNGLTLPAVSVAPTGALSNGIGGTASVTTSRTAGNNAQLTIRGQPGDVVSTTVPESFTVVRSGGQETLTVKTNTSAEYQVGSGDVVLGDAFGSTMSVDVGGSLALASAQNLVPGPYEGMLVVVVQYN
ncbi:DUF4402 domain-containing protein [Phenylobacterium sp. VNQ135]|uniref:DUF4402 domain-containing protein n=1 Tax=Phenylobacterium sp. VNQ135 TaxID=3400922 RepID=UPI003BFF6967